MRSRLIEHLLSIVLVALAFSILVIFMKGTQAELQAARTSALEPYLQRDFIDFGDPMHRAMFKETLDIFYPERRAGNDSLMLSIEAYRQEQFTSEVYKTGGEERGLSGRKALELRGMYLQFALVYLVVMVLSYHAAQSLAIIRFVNARGKRSSSASQMLEHVRKVRLRDPSWYLNLVFLLLKSVGIFFGTAILFAPAYVIAYSIRSGIDTGSTLFLILLGVVSNGLLISRSNRFYTFLMAENHKGYVQASIVRNLDSSYQWGDPHGIPYRAVLRPKALFPSHVFRHVFLNARHQYLPSLKEHASFLITGLIIIEMALNIQGRLGYELLQNILYKQYDVAAAIVVGVFVIVKVTDIVVDAWVHHESARYENRE